MKFLHSTNRIESLSDAVFAFAATLMVVNIGTETTFTSIEKDLPNFLSFAVSFFAMMMIWKVHYNFFRRTKYIDNWIITLNMFLLFMILFYVFPIKSLLITGFDGKRISMEDFSNIFQLYSVGFTLIFLCIALMYFRVFKKDKQNKEHIKLLFYTRHFLIFVVVGCLSFILAKLQVGLRFGFPGIIYGILGPLCYFHSKHFYKKYNLEY
ncbi:TMEM175 family protein [Polaribacter sp.]|nr:TMEM175 family protein [Polaribacter sp.]